MMIMAEFDFEWFCASKNGISNQMHGNEDELLRGYPGMIMK
jgi:hypothetical protein